MSQCPGILSDLFATCLGASFFLGSSFDAKIDRYELTLTPKQLDGSGLGGRLSDFAISLRNQKALPK
jgi:hypothetical protein